MKSMFASPRSKAIVNHRRSSGKDGAGPLSDKDTGSKMRWLTILSADHKNRKERMKMKRAMIKRLRQQFAPRGSGRLVAKLDIYAVNKALKKAVAV